MNEASKAAERRKLDPRYNDWIRGRVLDVGCGEDLISTDHYPNITEAVGYDLILGHKDAETLPELQDQKGTFDCVHSSHCLEHLPMFLDAIMHWFEMLRPGGHLVITVPDEDLYEQGVFPSRWNADHKTTWTLQKITSWSPNCQRVFELITNLQRRFNNARPILIQRCEHGYDFNLENVDQTYDMPAESAIEFVIRREAI